MAKSTRELMESVQSFLFRDRMSARLFYVQGLEQTVAWAGEVDVETSDIIVLLEHSFNFMEPSRPSPKRTH